MNTVYEVQNTVHYLLWLTNSQWRKLRDMERRIPDEELEYFILLVNEATK